MSWAPTKIKAVDAIFGTATEAVRVKTDAGYGFLKALGNRGGPHLLVADWVGTQLAGWLGLPVFETAIIAVGVAPEIRFPAGNCALPGPAFIAREMPGHVWSGLADDLQALVNPEDVARLVVFDTWTRNPDRYPPDPSQRGPNLNNVFLQDAGKGRVRLIAMDHTHCFAADRDLGPRTARIEAVQDPQIYGLFPAFEPFLKQHTAALTSSLRRLEELDAGWVERVIFTVPAEWELEPAAGTALGEFICRRAVFVASSLLSLLPESIRPGQPPLL
jgi:hypothetical protein